VTLHDLWALLTAIGTVLAGLAAWRASWRSRRVERDVDWSRLAKALARGDEMQREISHLRSECRRLHALLRQATDELSRARKALLAYRSSDT
jgi:hypothetical protein